MNSKFSKGDVVRCPRVPGCPIGIITGWTATGSYFVTRLNGARSQCRLLEDIVEAVDESDPDHPLHEQWQRENQTNESQ